MAEYQELHNWLMHVREHFIRMDADGSKSLNYNEIYNAIQSSGYNIDMVPFQSLVATFDPDRSGSIGLEPYLALCAMLKQASKVFSLFDPQRTGKITLDFNQFIYAAAQIR